MATFSLANISNFVIQSPTLKKAWSFTEGFSAFENAVSSKYISIHPPLNRTNTVFSNAGGPFLVSSLKAVKVSNPAITATASNTSATSPANTNGYVDQIRCTINNGVEGDKMLFVVTVNNSNLI